MKEKNKILLLFVLFSLFVILIINLTSPVSLYRDPWMFRHFYGAEFILQKNNIFLWGEQIDKIKFFGEEFLLYKKPVFYFVPVLLGTILSFISGLDIYFLFNNFFFLLFIVSLSFFIFFRELFQDSRLALGLSLIVLLFPFEAFYYKITIHGWYFVRVFSALSFYFLARLLKSNFSFKSKNFFLFVFFCVLGIYSDKSAFALVLFPLILFFVVFFFFERNQIQQKKNKLNALLLFFFLLFIFSFYAVFLQILLCIQAITYNLLNLNFVPSFISPNLPFSEFYLQKGFSYILFRYFLPFLVVFSLLLLNFNKIKSFVFKNNLIKSFVLSQLVFCVLVFFGMLFSFVFVSGRGLTMIFFFFCLVSFIGLNEMKKSFLKKILIFFFFLLVLITPLLYYTQAPEYNYEQLNQKHLSSISWMKENLAEKKIYSDLKMAKAILLKTDINTAGPPYEFGEFMEEDIIPFYYSGDSEAVVKRMKSYEVTHLVLTKEMSELMVQPANELLKPATHLSKFDESDYFNKIFENTQVRVYEINFDLENE